MKTIHLVGLALLEVAAIAGLATYGLSRPPNVQILMQVLPTENAKNGEVWLRPYTAPSLNFRLVSGKAPTKGPLLCDVSMIARERAEHTDLIMQLSCEEGLVLELQGVDLNGK